MVFQDVLLGSTVNMLMLTFSIKVMICHATASLHACMLTIMLSTAGAVYS